RGTRRRAAASRWSSCTPTPPATNAHTARVPREAGKLWVGTAIPNALYVAFGLILSAGGVSQALAGALSGMGESYLVAMPFLGAFAGFITASNTGAMALIGPLQMDTGAALGVPPPWSNGLHNAAAGWG
ncbi:L-lactate permease, partial [Escherichia coli]|nr:L-lactate permease [Escherichia coli]